MRALTGRRGAATLVAVLAVLGLVAGACGGGRSDSADDTTSSSASTGDSASTDGAMFGDLPSPCGPGTPSGAPDKGVTAEAINIAYGDDAGFQATPGRGHEATDAVNAMIAWCNEQGGINGRTLVGNYYDAKITEVNNVMTEACAKDFALVGQAWALIAGAETIRQECGLPTVPAITTGADIVNAPLMATPIPQPVDYNNVAGWAQIAEKFPEEVKKTGIMQPNFPAVIDYTQRFKGSVNTVGWEFLDCTQTYPIGGVADYRPYLQAIKDCGATAVFTTDVGTNFSNMLDAAEQIDFHPIWTNSTTAYEQQFANWNVNGNGDDLYLGNLIVPLDYTPEGSANALYVDLVTKSGGDLSFSGQQATSAFLLWATAADACGNELTRACLMDQLHGIHSWTAGGLQSAQDPGANIPGHCALVMKLTGTSYVQWAPAEEGQFACDEKWLVKVDPPIDSAAALNLVDRIATNHTGG